MRKAFLWATLIILLPCASAMAHPPSSIDIAFDPDTQAVNVTVNHDVKDTKTHYIKEIDVSVNGKPLLTDKYTFQDNNKTQPAVYELPDLAPGDKVSVKASCSISGMNTAELTVPKQ